MQVLYEAQKREKLATKQRLAAQRAGQAREVRIGCQIAEHDLAVKMAQVGGGAGQGWGPAVGWTAWQPP